jgi:protein SCO1/2
MSLALTAATGGALLMYYNHLMEQKLNKNAVAHEAAVGKPMIGGPFELTDQEGRPFSDADLRGRWSLLYFGFTFCPDICPDELEKMAEAVDAVEKGSGGRVQPVFISLDPERDTVPQVARYVKEFHPRLIGLTGPKAKTDAAAKAYRVYHMKTDESEDYLVDHSIIMYLVNPEGDFVQFFGKNVDAAGLAKAIQGHMASWKPKPAEA